MATKNDGKQTAFTVEELIAVLEKCDPHASVIVDGYEGGYDSMNTVELRDIEWNSNMKGNGRKKHGWNGAHDMWFEGRPNRRAVVYLSYTPTE